MEFKKVLFLAPHADDSEMSSGGFISRLIRERKEVFVVVFSEAFDDKTHTRLGEFYESMKELKVPRENLFVYNFRMRELGEDRQNILEIMREIKELVDPDLVIFPSPEDVHQDHQVICQEAIRAFKGISMFGYEYPWNQLVFKTTLFIKLEDEDLENKIRALSMYKSQQSRDYFNPEVIRGWALTRGVGCKSKYAESYEILRFII